MRGYFGIGIYHPKTEQNIGTLFRSAASLGASFIFTIGRRYQRQSSDTCDSAGQIPLYHYYSFESFLDNRPRGARIVGIEIDETARPLKNFVHPENCIYLLGAEDHGLTKDVIRECNHIVVLPGSHCLNVSVAGSIVMYDRISKGQK